jgi:hypothetical protein
LLAEQVPAGFGQRQGPEFPFLPGACPAAGECAAPDPETATGNRGRAPGFMTREAGSQPDQASSAEPRQDEAADTAAGLQAELESLRSESALCALQLSQVRDELLKYYALHEAARERIAEFERSTGNSSAPGADRSGRGRPGLRRNSHRSIAIPGWVAVLLGERRRRMRANLEKVVATRYFDAQWYLEKYPDVAASGMDPLRHYLDFGAQERRNPGPKFDTGWYLGANPDVAASGINPLLHFIEFGIFEGRQPNPSMQLLRKSLYASEAENKTLKQLLEEREAGIEALKASLADREQALRTLQQKVEILEKDKVRLAAEMEQERVRQARMTQEQQSRIEQLQAGIAGLEETAAALQGQLDLARRDAERATQLNMIREGDLEELRLRHKSLKQARAEQEQLLGELGGMLELAAGYFGSLERTGDAASAGKKARKKVPQRPEEAVAAVKRRRKKAK